MRKKKSMGFRSAGVIGKDTRTVQKESLLFLYSSSSAFFSYFFSPFYSADELQEQRCCCSCAPSAAPVGRALGDPLLLSRAEQVLGVDPVFLQHSSSCIVYTHTTPSWINTARNIENGKPHLFTYTAETIESIDPHFICS